MSGADNGGDPIISRKSFAVSPIRSITKEKSAMNTNTGARTPDIAEGFSDADLDEILHAPGEPASVARSSNGSGSPAAGQSTASIWFARSAVSAETATAPVQSTEGDKP
jgi:hypothetical protein